MRHQTGLLTQCRRLSDDAGNKVLEELASSGANALLDYREVPNLSDGSLKISHGLSISRYSINFGTLQLSRSYPAPENPALKRFVLPGDLRLAWRLYMSFYLWIPKIRSGPRVGRYLLNLPFEDWRSPFGRDFRCLYGDQWFSGNAKVAEILLSPKEKDLQLRRHLRFRHFGDECYYQTVLGNTPGLKISKATRRYVDWFGDSGQNRAEHPKWLGLDDLPAIISSQAHFARKFLPNTAALDELDRMLG